MLRALLLAFWLPVAAFAQGLPDPISDRVNDFADLLPPEAEARVSETLRLAREETGVQMVLVTMESTAANGGVGEPIADYAKRLFNHWGVGDAERNDGILILVARTDREMRIALGSGYPVIWDNAAQRVIDRFMLPEFREDRYAEGIELGVTGAVDLLARPFSQGAKKPVVESDPTDWVETGLLAILVAAVFGTIFRRRIGDFVVRMKACPNCGRRTLSRSREILEHATGSMAGRGMTHIHCSSCGMDRSEEYRIARSSDSNSDSGFGGGSSSGGGATGRW